MTKMTKKMKIAASFTTVKHAASNPAIQNAVSSPAIQNAVSNPAIQKQKIKIIQTIKLKLKTKIIQTIKLKLKTKIIQIKRLNVIIILPPELYLRVKNNKIIEIKQGNIVVAVMKKDKFEEWEVYNVNANIDLEYWS
jgi:hypothetical protein